MTDIRISGLSGLTRDAIGACAYIAAHEGIDMTTGDRLAILTEAFEHLAVEVRTGSPDESVLERGLLKLAAIAGMWVDAMTALPPAQESEQKPRKLVRLTPAQREGRRAEPSDPSIDFSNEDD